MVSFEDAVERALTELPSPVLQEIAKSLQKGHGSGPAAAAELVAAAKGMNPAAAAAYLSGAIAGYRRGVETQQVEVVFSGPATPIVPVRSTAQALLEVVNDARRELLLMTYSAKPYPPLIVALIAACNRGVAVDVVVETLAGAGSALSGSEPAAAFENVPGVNLWHWPADKRPTGGAKMHAKVAVVDRRVLLLSSVNLTESGVEHSLEAGLIVRGGHAPRRVAEHIEQLQADGVLLPIGPR